VSTTTVNYITIDSSPVANFTSSVTDLMVDFNNTSTNANSYAWDFGDNAGTSMDENPSYTYAADGTYSVILSATNEQSLRHKKSLLQRLQLRALPPIQLPAVRQ
jgi:PKD repeat protein